MLEMGKQSGEFFQKEHDEYGRRAFRLKSMEQYSREHGSKEQPSKKYFSATTLPDIIKNYPMPRKNMKPAEIERGKDSANFCRSISLTPTRNAKPASFYRFRSGVTEPESSGTMDASPSKTASFHHATKVHGSVRATNDNADRI
jgi:dual specificity protein kinase YAK1